MQTLCITSKGREECGGVSGEWFNDKDNGLRMHIFFSFKAFLEVVKRTSLPRENVEIGAKGIREQAYHGKMWKLLQKGL
jgi:hypothetical protein